MDLIGVATGIPSNALWDGFKKAWEISHRKSVEQLYWDSFTQAFTELRPNFAQYADQGEVVFHLEPLVDLIQQDLAVRLADRPFSTLVGPEFTAKLTALIAGSDMAVLEIGGHTLTAEGYTQLVTQLVNLATNRFFDALLSNEPAFRRTLVEEMLVNQGFAQSVLATLAQLNSRMDDQFGQLREILLSAVMAQNQALAQRVQELEHRTPTLRVLFMEEEKRTAHIVRPGRRPDTAPPSDADLDRSLAQERERLESIATAAQAKLKGEPEGHVPSEDASGSGSQAPSEAAKPGPRKSGLILSDLIRRTEQAAGSVDKIKSVQEQAASVRQTIAGLEATLNSASVRQTLQIGGNGRLPTKDEVERFSKACKTYIRELGPTLRWTRSRDFGTRCEFELLLENIGEAPARNIELWLTFPSGAFVHHIPPYRDEDDEDHRDLILTHLDQVPLPDRPVPPWTRLFGVDEVWRTPLHLGLPERKEGFFALGDYSRLYYKRELLAGDERTFLTIVAYLPAPDPGTYAITYVARCDDQRKMARGTLEIIVQ